MEPTLLLPMGFGAILVNLPVAVPDTGVQHVLNTLFSIGILRKEGYDVQNAEFFKIGIPFTMAAIIPPIS